MVSFCHSAQWSRDYLAGLSPLFHEEAISLLIAVNRDETFVCYSTSTYKMTLFETISGYKFVMLTDPSAEGVRFILRQIYTGPFVEYVVRNPLMTMDSKERGFDNDNFRNATDRLVKNLSIFSQ
jgi:hypothetical protein